MARGVNKVILIGTLGNDPETKYMPNGDAVTTISIATNESWKDKQTGQQQERTEWHRIVAFRRLAEIMGEYLRKGSQVYIEGKLQTRKWQAQDGTDRYTTEIIANDMQMLGRRSQSDDSTTYNQQPENQSRHASNNTAPPSQTSPQQSTQSIQGFDDFDDDIPF